MILQMDEIEAIARQMKIERLRRLPGMDKVAVALNAKPTYDEIEDLLKVIRAIEDAGYVILSKHTQP